LIYLKTGQLLTGAPATSSCASSCSFTACPSGATGTFPSCVCSNAYYDATTNMCVACSDIDATKPYWNASTKVCTTCASVSSSKPYYNGTSCIACPTSTSYQDGVCKLTKAVGTCAVGYIAIKTAQELASIGNNDNYPSDANYCLLNDIALTAYQTNEGWTPIPSFEGIFDGNSKKITGLYINRGKSYQALFASNSGTIKKLGVVGMTTSDGSAAVTGYKYVGALVGSNSSSGVISDCYADVDVAGSDYYTGGFAASNSGSITNSYAKGDVTIYVRTGESSPSAGGFVARNGGAITNSYYTSGTIINEKGNNSLMGFGGLVGENNGTVTNSYVTSTTLESVGRAVGGVVGDNGGLVEDSYFSSGTIVATDGNADVGGVVGENYGGDIVGSYFSGTLTVKGSNSYAGGIAGSSGTITNSYSSGNITTEDGHTDVGGIIGSHGTVSNCHSSANITANDYYATVGGISGGYATSIKDSYYSGTITFKDYYTNAGGIAGETSSSTTISNCYFRGKIVKDTTSTSHIYIGGIVGENDGSVSSSYYDTTVSGLTVGCGDNEGTCSATAKTTSQMQTSSAFSGWSTSIWKFASGAYPKLVGVGGQ